jgi:hypothetical protein
MTWPFKRRRYRSPFSRSARKRAQEQQEREHKRSHWHVCEYCEHDEPYICLKYPCQHLKKKACPEHRRALRWKRYPEVDLFTPLPKVIVAVQHVSVTLGPNWYAVYLDGTTRVLTSGEIALWVNHGKIPHD